MDIISLDSLTLLSFPGCETDGSNAEVLLPRRGANSRGRVSALPAGMRQNQRPKLSAGGWLIG